MKSSIMADLDKLYPWLTSVLQAANVTFDELLRPGNVDGNTMFKLIGDVLDRLALSTEELHNLLNIETDLNMLRQFRLQEVHERRVRRQLGGKCQSHSGDHLVQLRI